MKACGSSMYDDYVEMKPGALRSLQRSLDQRRSHGTSHVTPIGILTAMWNSARRTLLPGTGRAQASLPRHNNQGTPATPMTGTTTTPDPPPTGPLQYLLLCIPFKRHATKLAHVPTPSPISDTHFFRLLRYQYTTLRGRFRRLFSIRTLAELHFVHFEVFHNDLADIRKLDVIPPDTQRDKYIYNPMPAEYVTPIGKN
nr:hypothetical protein B0A51_12295 [Rachicladosporium sp. CCFEE 5018]